MSSTTRPTKTTTITASGTAPGTTPGKAPEQPTACILCPENCGLLVSTEAGRITRIRGDKNHPTSRGYLCQKAQKLDHYQNNPNRLTSPLRRRPDGTFEEVSWDTAIVGIAAELRRIRDTHGGHSLAYYGGGGQGNHMGGAYAGTLRVAMKTRYLYTALAQEKTGGFFVNGRLFGNQQCHPTEDVEHSDYVLFIGTNPWQSHGFPRARKVLQTLAKDPARTMVVVDPRRTETAQRADMHLQVKPGGDAHFMLAMLGVLVQEELYDRDFLDRRTTGFASLRPVLRAIDVDAYARLAGLDPEAVRTVARGYARAKAGCVRTDLGLEHSPHSTLNTYLSKLLFLLSGHFGKPGGNNLHVQLVPLIGHSKEPHEGGRRTRVTGTHEISKMYPPNILPAEIDCDHPERIRGVVVDSSNPLVSAADTQAYRRAFGKLELLVVIDVALTETARLAHWVLPVHSQFEKWEATFFNLEFPDNFFHLRRPVFQPRGNTLPEQEIYRRIAVAMGEIPERFPVLEQVARMHRRYPRLKLLQGALMAAFKLKPKWRRYAPIILYQTLGEALPEGARTAAVLWALCQKFAEEHPYAVKNAGVLDTGAGLGEALFARVLGSPSGAVISAHRHSDMWSFIAHKDGRIHLDIPEMLAEIADLGRESGLGAPEGAQDGEYPFVLLAGERRSYNANTIIREESWRQKDADGALKVHPDDAEALGLAEGGQAVCESARGQVTVRVTVSDEVLPGVVSLPHGFGMDEDRGDGNVVRTGPRINELTVAEHCDAIAKTPFHKHVPVRIRAL